MQLRTSVNAHSLPFLTFFVVRSCEDCSLITLQSPLYFVLLYHVSLFSTESGNVWEEHENNSVVAHHKYILDNLKEKILLRRYLHTRYLLNSHNYVQLKCCYIMDSILLYHLWYYCVIKMRTASTRVEANVVVFMHQIGWLNECECTPPPPVIG